MNKINRPKRLTQTQNSFPIEILFIPLIASLIAYYKYLRTNSHTFLHYYSICVTVFLTTLAFYLLFCILKGKGKIKIIAIVFLIALIVLPIRKAPIEFILSAATLIFCSLLGKVVTSRWQPGLMPINQTVIGIVLTVSMQFLLTWAQLFNRNVILVIFLLLILARSQQTKDSIEQIYLKRIFNIKADLNRSNLKLDRQEAILLATLGSIITVAVTYASIPDLMYDSVSFKAWLPAYNAQEHSMGLPLFAPWAGVAGLFSQLLAIPNLFHRGNFGGYVQLIMLTLLIYSVYIDSTVTKFKKKLIYFFIIVAISSPIVFWEFASSYDDIFLMILLASLSLQVINLKASASNLYFIGLAASALILGKLHTVPFSYGLGLFAVAMISRKEVGPRKRIKQTISYFALFNFGVLSGILIPWSYRYIQTGNPVFPVLNRIFRSPYFEQSGSLTMGDPYSWPTGLPWWEVFVNLITHPENYGGKGFPYSAAIPVLVISVFTLGAVLNTFRRKSVYALMWVGILFSTILFWTLTSFNVRYLIPYLIAVPILHISFLSESSKSNITSRKLGKLGLVPVAIFGILIPQDVLYFSELKSEFPSTYITSSETSSEFTQRFDSTYLPLQWLNLHAPKDALVGGINIYQRGYLRPDIELSFGWEIATKYREFGDLDFFILRASELESDYASSDFRGQMAQKVIACGEEVYSDTMFKVFKLKKIQCSKYSN